MGFYTYLLQICTFISMRRIGEQTRAVPLTQLLSNAEADKREAPSYQRSVTI